MNIWTFDGSGLRGVARWAALTIGMGVLCACVPGTGTGSDGPSFFRAQSGEGNTRTRPVPNVALNTAKIGAGGALTIVPPDGFCVDKRSKKQAFLVVARCDTLGGRGGAKDASLGLITVSATGLDGAADPGALLAGLIPDAAQELSRGRQGDLSFLRLKGAAPQGADPVHWRGLAQIGDQLVLLSAFAPPGGEFSGQAGADALISLVDRSQARSLADRVASERSAKDTGGKPVGATGGFLSGLFGKSG